MGKLITYEVFREKALDRAIKKAEKERREHYDPFWDKFDRLADLCENYDENGKKVDKS